MSNLSEKLTRVHNLLTEIMAKPGHDSATRQQLGSIINQIYDISQEMNKPQTSENQKSLIQRSMDVLSYIPWILKICGVK
jgi:hypothetical protein